MKRKIIIYGVLLIVMSLGLTGCSIQLDDGDVETIKKIKDNTNITVNGKNIDIDNVENLITNDGNENNVTDGDYNPIEEDSRVQVSYMDMGNSFYIIVYGHDEQGNTTWTYETEKVIYDENAKDTVTNYMGTYNDETTYLIDNGVIKILNANDGKEIYSSNKKYSLNQAFYMVDQENGELRMFYGSALDGFLVLDKKGNIKADVDLKKYEKDFKDIPNYGWSADYDSEKITMIGSTIDWDDEIEDLDEEYKEWLLNIDLNTYEVSVKEIKHEDVKTDMLKGKVLFCEYGHTYYFGEDGTFMENFENDYIDKYSTLRYNGIWKIENNHIKLKYTEEIVAEGGHYEYEEYNNKYLVDYDEKSIPTNREDEFSIKYYKDYKGKEMISLNRELFEITEPVG